MKWRILIGYGTLTVFVLLMLEVPLGVTYSRRQSDELTTQLERDAFFLGSVTQDQLVSGRGDLLERVRRYQRRYGPRVVVVDREGEVVADSHPLSGADQTMLTRPEMASALHGQVATGRRHSSSLHTDLLYVAVPVASGGKVLGAIRLTYSTSVLDQRVRRYWLGLGLVGLVSLAGAGVLGMILAWSATRPLRLVEDAATRFGEGSLGSRAPVTGPPEVRAMARTFNDTADRLAGLIEAQQAFVANASHQLRTPLTAVQLRLENLQAETEGEAADDAEVALAELARMASLVDGLLTLARAEGVAATGAEQRAIVDIGAVLDERKAVWDPVAAEQGVQIEVDAGSEGPPQARAAAERIAQVLDNLLANALDASPAGGRVELRAATEGASVVVHVVDDGPGLAARDREQAFDRFWRAPGPPKRLGGSGLGLSIARALAAADDGTVELREAGGGGVDAVVTLPAAREGTRRSR